MLAYMCCLIWLFIYVGGVFGADTDAVKSVSVMEGDSVILNPDVTEIQTDEQVVWMFGPQKTRLAELHRKKIYIDDSNTIFEKKLQIDNQTGSLTIRNIRTEHTGLYKLQLISNKRKLDKTFNVTVYAPLPVPVITSDSSQCSSSERSSTQYCSLVCSVLNVSHVTLSWYAGISVLSSISVCDLSISLSLPLEVEYQDNNTYSCVINNPVRNQTTHLNITQLCHTCEDFNIFSEGVTPSLIYALVGITAVALLVYYIRYRRKSHNHNLTDAILFCGH